MKLHILFVRVISLSLIALFSAKLPAQKRFSDTAFIPEVGQQGKDVIWVPTPPELVDVMLSMAKVKPEDYVIDLGSGDGRIPIAAARLGANALGIEYNPDMVALSKRNAVKDKVSDKVEFIAADLFECDLSRATVITMFLLPELNLKLRPRLLELKPGTRIVSNTFSMGEWEPDYEITTEENWNSWNTALLWIVPAKVAGMWKVGNDELLIKQNFQMIYGTLTSKGKATTITDGRLNGNEITFKTGKTLYIGIVEGTKMSGTVNRDDYKNNWTAVKQGL